MLSCALLALSPTRTHADKTPPHVETILPAVIVWTADVTGSSGLPPAFDPLHAYVPLASGELTAIRLDDGQVAWWVAVAPVISPVPGGDLVFVPEDGIITALQAATGAVAWRSPLQGRVSTAPIYDTGWLIAALEAGELVALRADTGEVIWRQPLGAAARVPPAIDADRLYVALEDKRIVSLDLTTGKMMWEQRLPDVASQPLAVADRVYVGARDNFFYCLAAATGRVTWRWRSGADVIGPPVVDDDRVYFTSLDNVLRALDRRVGNQRWQRPLTIRPAGPPIHADTSIVVSGRTLDLRAFLVKDGRPSGRFTEALEIVGGPFFRRGATTDLHRLYALTYSEDFALRLVALAPWREPGPRALEQLPGTPLPQEPGPPSFFPTDLMPTPWLAGEPPPG